MQIKRRRQLACKAYRVLTVVSVVRAYTRKPALRHGSDASSSASLLADIFNFCVSRAAKKWLELGVTDASTRVVVGLGVRYDCPLILGQPTT
jgi:hypothetical protein